MILWFINKCRIFDTLSVFLENIFRDMRFEKVSPSIIFIKFLDIVTYYEHR